MCEFETHKTGAFLASWEFESFDNDSFVRQTMGTVDDPVNARLGNNFACFVESRLFVFHLGF